MAVISSIGIGYTTTASLLCLCIVSFDLFCLQSTLVIFLGISQKQIILKRHIRNCLYFMKINPRLSVLAQFHLIIKAMSQPLCFDIDYSGSYRPFRSKKWHLIKIKEYLHHITLKIIYSIKNYIHHQQGFQLQHPAVILTIHMLIISIG